MKAHKFRASSLAEIMTDPKAKGEVLSVGAKTAVEKIAKQLVYGYTETFSSKYTEKGIQVEPVSLALYNSVFFTDYQKNTERKTNDWITGECDIFTGDSIIDIKSSWSLATFPATAAAGIDKGYEWQLRAYMMLYDRPQAELIYCLVTTDSDLLSSFDDKALHQVDHIPADKRITVLKYDRDILLEAEIMERLALCSEYYENYMQQLNNK